MSTYGTCVSCGKVGNLRGRSLCNMCHSQPDIRSKYTFIGEGKYHGEGDFNGGYTLASSPTFTLPGTEERILALQKRVEQRVSLWHPLDGPWNA